MKKIIVIGLILATAFVIVVVAMGDKFDFLPGTTSQSPSTPTSEYPVIPQRTYVPSSTTITYDFDNGNPVLFEGQNTPFSQMSGGVTAYFSSPSDPAAFSVQSYRTTFYTLSEFSGNYLFDNKIPRDILYISFSQPITDITLTFATVEYHGPGHVDKPSTMKLTAYKDSINNTIGSATAKGIVSNNLFPQGELSYDAGEQSFNIIRIEMLFQQPGGTDFLVDNIIVITA
jgi:hypothetical protein